MVLIYMPKPCVKCGKTTDNKFSQKHTKSCFFLCEDCLKKLQEENPDMHITDILSMVSDEVKNGKVLRNVF